MKKEGGCLLFSLTNLWYNMGMNEYTDFATVYDLFMDNVPYEEWAGFITRQLHNEDIRRGVVVDLGCGTGVLTRLMKEQGYQMIGVEISPEMLSIAAGKEVDSDVPILYLNQDLRELELPDKVEAFISTCDTLNYLLSPVELKEVFARAYRYLKKGGVFFFDFNTVHKYRDIIGEETIAESREDGAFIWDNYYDEEECLNEYEVTFFLQEEGELFRRHREVHTQRAYEFQEIRFLLEEVGFTIKGEFDDYQEVEPNVESERICLLAQKINDKE